jgi:hypothetical protein
MRRPLALKERPIDLLFLAFFAVNALFVVYCVDIEQVLVDPANPTAAVWPPQPLIRLLHDYGRTVDPALLAREAYWKGGIWVDLLFFGPFYFVALYAYTKGREWIRIPTLMWGSSILTSTTIIVFEEVAGRHRSPEQLRMWLTYGPWLLVPALAIWRMARAPHPFSVPSTEPAPSAPSDAPPPSLVGEARA